MGTALNDGYIMLDLTIYMMKLILKSCIRSNNTSNKINVSLQIVTWKICADLVKTATSSLGWAESESPMRSLTLWRRLRTRSPAASPIAIPLIESSNLHSKTETETQRVFETWISHKT